jgi:hypothetical protein
LKKVKYSSSDGEDDNDESLDEPTAQAYMDPVSEEDHELVYSQGSVIAFKDSSELGYNLASLI